MNQQKSKLVLGTVQLGVKYGLNNVHEQPTQEESFSILDAALAEGINTFDTAFAYGTAEDVLGAWIKERSLADKVFVVSKMKPHILNEYADGTKAADIVRTEIEKSLARLQLKSLDGYLFHSPHYIYLKHLVEGMQNVRDSGLVSNIGVSVYNEDEALQAVELGVDYVQIPYNVFDQRLDRTNFFEIAQKNNVTVFARSPFLQGLLLMRPEQLPPHLTHIRPYLEQFIEITKRHNLSATQASLLFAEMHCRAEHIVFGVDTLAQLHEDLSIVNNHEQPSEAFVQEIVETFKDFNRGAVNPSLWSKIKK